MKVSSIRHTPARVLRMQPASQTPSPASQVLDDDIFQWFGRASCSVVPEAAPAGQQQQKSLAGFGFRVAAAHQGLGQRQDVLGRACAGCAAA